MDYRTVLRGKPASVLKTKGAGWRARADAVELAEIDIRGLAASSEPLESAQLMRIIEVSRSCDRYVDEVLGVNDEGMARERNEIGRAHV